MHVWGGSSEHGDTCHFPFLHRSVAYQTCTTTDKNGPWCYTTADRSRWGFCELAVPVVGGNAPAGSVCHFPGTYRGAKYYECFQEGRDRPWCYTNQEQTQWGDCAMQVKGGQSEDGDTCFTRCSGSYHTKPWCWIDEQDSKWGECLFNVVYRTNRPVASDETNGDGSGDSGSSDSRQSSSSSSSSKSAGDGSSGSKQSSTGSKQSSGSSKYSDGSSKQSSGSSKQSSSSSSSSSKSAGDGSSSKQSSGSSKQSSSKSASSQKSK